MSIGECFTDKNYFMRYDIAIVSEVGTVIEEIRLLVSILDMISTPVSIAFHSLKALVSKSI